MCHWSNQGISSSNPATPHLARYSLEDLERAAFVPSEFHLESTDPLRQSKALTQEVTVDDLDDDGFPQRPTRLLFPEPGNPVNDQRKQND